MCFRDYVFDPSSMRFLKWNRILIIFVRRVKKILIFPIILININILTFLFMLENKVLFRETINHAISFIDKISCKISNWAEVGR